MLADDHYNDTTSLVKVDDGEEVDENQDDELAPPVYSTRLAAPKRKERRMSRRMLSIMCLFLSLIGIGIIIGGGTIIYAADTKMRSGWSDTICTPVNYAVQPKNGTVECLYVVVDVPQQHNVCAVPASIVRTNGISQALACGDEAQREHDRWAHRKSSAAPVRCLVPKNSDHFVTASECRRVSLNSGFYSRFMASNNNEKLVYLIDSSTQGEAALYALTNPPRIVGAIVLVLGIVVFFGTGTIAFWTQLVEYCIHRPRQVRIEQLRRRGQWKDAAD